MLRKFLPLTMGALLVFLIYTIYDSDLKVKDLREYDKKVVIYSTTRCHYCAKAKELLNRRNVPFADIDITWDKELYKKLVLQTDQETVPYVFINDQFIGGYEDLVNLDSKNALLQMLR